MIDKKIRANFDLPLFIATIVISILGIIAVYYASSPSTHYLKLQSQWVLISLVAMSVVIVFDYRDYGSIIYLIYGVNIILLLAVIFIGDDGGGAQRWIKFGTFTLQPSETAKVAVIITLGHLMAKESTKVDNLLDLIRPGIHVAIPMVLIFLQPDLGTSLVFVAIVFGMLFVAGLKWKYIFLLGGAGVGASIFAFHNILQPYQQIRLIVFRDPYEYYDTSGFQIIQSKIAVGSGGIWGKRGDEIDYFISNKGFLPEAHTDFIFSVIGEKFGLIGSTIVLLLFVFIIYRILNIAMTASDAYGTYICVGVASLLAFQVLVNVGMTLSIMPVTGLPLPFITYGGSTTLTSFILIGLVLNVGLRRERKGIF